MTGINQLVLYSSSYCFFCHKVLNFLQSQNIQVDIKDTSQNPTFREELLEKGGKTQVPCLMINDSPLYESDDIIQWFKDNINE